MAHCVSPFREVPPSQLPLAFLYPPEKPSIFSRPLTDVTVTEGEDLTLVCETTTLDSSVRWTKDGKTLRPSARCQLSHEGHQAQLVITGTTLQDGGRYKCEVGGASSSSIVRVHGECQVAMFGPRIKICPRAEGGRGPQSSFWFLSSVSFCCVGHLASLYPRVSTAPVVSHPLLVS